MDQWNRIELSNRYYLVQVQETFQKRREKWSSQ